MSHKRRHPKRESRTDELLEDILLVEEDIDRKLTPRHPTYITFTEVTMNPTEAGQTQVFTGTFSPAGSVPPTDAVYSVTSNDPAVSPTVDSTGLIVSVTYPAGWVESTTDALAFSYAASSASVPWTLSATITPSAPPATNFPTSVTFTQTT